MAREFIPRARVVATVNNYISGVANLYVERGWVGASRDVRARAVRGGFGRFVRALRRRAPSRQGSIPIPPSLLRLAILQSWPSRGSAPPRSSARAALWFDRQVTLCCVMWLAFHGLLRVGELVPALGTGFSEREDIDRGRLIGWHSILFLDEAGQPVHRASSGTNRLSPPSFSIPHKVRLSLSAWKWNDYGRAQAADIDGLPRPTAYMAGRRWEYVVDGSADGFFFPLRLWRMRERLSQQYGHPVTARCRGGLLGGSARAPATPFASRPSPMPCVPPAGYIRASRQWIRPQCQVIACGKAAQRRRFGLVCLSIACSLRVAGCTSPQ